MLLRHLPQLSLHLLLIGLYQYIQQHLDSILHYVWIMYDIIPFSLFRRICFLKKVSTAERTSLPNNICPFYESQSENIIRNVSDHTIYLKYAMLMLQI